MPTRRVFMLVLLEVVGIEIAVHGIFRPWFARNASKEGLSGDLAQAGLLVG